MTIERGGDAPAGGSDGRTPGKRPRALDNLKRLEERIHAGEQAAGPSPAGSSSPAGSGGAATGGPRAAAIGKKVGKETIWVLGSGLKWVLSTVGGIILFIVWLEMRSCASSVFTGEGEKEVTDEDRAVLVMAADLPVFSDHEIDPDSVYLAKYSDGDTIYLNYDVAVYDEDEDLGANLVVNLEFCENEADATEFFKEAERESRYGYDEIDADVEDRTDEFTWGDQCVFWTWDGDYPTIYFLARKGNRVYELTINGPELMDVADLRSILEPRLRKFEKL